MEGDATVSKPRVLLLRSSQRVVQGDLAGARVQCNHYRRLNIGAFQSNRYRVTGLNTANAALVPNFNFRFPTAQVTDGQRIGQLAVKLIF